MHTVPSAQKMDLFSRVIPVLIWFTCSAISRLPISDNVAESEILKGNVCLIAALLHYRFPPKMVKIDERRYNVIHNAVRCITVVLIVSALATNNKK